MTTLRK
jgi:hypothetical protein